MSNRVRTRLQTRTAVQRERLTLTRTTGRERDALEDSLLTSAPMPTVISASHRDANNKLSIYGKTLLPEKQGNTLAPGGSISGPAREPSRLVCLHQDSDTIIDLDASELDSLVTSDTSDEGRGRATHTGPLEPVISMTGTEGPVSQTKTTLEAASFPDPRATRHPATFRRDESLERLQIPDEVWTTTQRLRQSYTRRLNLIRAYRRITDAITAENGTILTLENKLKVGYAHKAHYLAKKYQAKTDRGTPTGVPTGKSSYTSRTPVLATPTYKHARRASVPAKNNTRTYSEAVRTNTYTNRAPTSQTHTHRQTRRVPNPAKTNTRTYSETVRAKTTNTPLPQPVRRQRRTRTLPDHIPEQTSNNINTQTNTNKHVRHHVNLLIGPYQAKNLLLPRTKIIAVNNSSPSSISRYLSNMDLTLYRRVTIFPGVDAFSTRVEARNYFHEVKKFANKTIENGPELSIMGQLNSDKTHGIATKTNKSLESAVGQNPSRWTFINTNPFTDSWQCNHNADGKTLNTQGLDIIHRAIIAK